jgi:hypothetical protein
MKAIFTKQMLIDAKACQSQIDLFAEKFGDHVVVTVAKARKVAGLFDWDFAGRFLSPTAWAEYNRVQGLAWAEYQRAKGLALAEYQRIQGPALAEYKRVTGPAWAAAYIATCTKRN